MITSSGPTVIMPILLCAILELVFEGGVKVAGKGLMGRLPGKDRLVVCLNLYRPPHVRSDVDPEIWNSAVVSHNTDVASAAEAFQSGRPPHEAHDELEILRFVGDCTLVFFSSGDLASAIDWLVQDMPRLTRRHQAAGPHRPWGIKEDLPATRAGIANGAIVHYCYPEDQRPGLANDSIGSPIDIAFQLAHLAAPGQVLLDMATLVDLVNGIDRRSCIAVSDSWSLQLDNRPEPSGVGQLLWDDVKTPALPVMNVAAEISLLSVARLGLANLETLILSERSFCDRLVQSPISGDTYQQRTSSARRQFVGAGGGQCGDALAPI